VKRAGIIVVLLAETIGMLLKKCSMARDCFWLLIERTHMNCRMFSFYQVFTLHMVVCMAQLAVAERTIDFLKEFMLLLFSSYPPQRAQESSWKVMLQFGETQRISEQQ
jgi:hypothetical protein